MTLVFRGGFFFTFFCPGRTGAYTADTAKTASLLHFTVPLLYDSLYGTYIVFDTTEIYHIKSYLPFLGITNVYRTAYAFWANVAQKGAMTFAELNRVVLFYLPIL